LRRLIEVAVTMQAPPSSLVAVTAAIEQAIATLAPHVPAPPPPRYPGVPPSGRPADFFPYDCAVGHWSPLAAPIEIAWEESLAVGRVTFGTAYEGPLGCVHGGAIAAVFDQLFTVANLMRGSAGPTAQLTVHFRRPTPLHTALRFEAWQERVEERKIHTAGRVLAGDEVTVEASGLFIHVPVDRVMNLLR
jgi:acyl-coenzyme A thioesterase PaaI-like protein